MSITAAKQTTAAAVIVLCILALGGCGFFVVFPLAAQFSPEDFEITPDDRIRIRVVFSQPVDFASIAPARPQDSAAALLSKNLLLRTNRVPVAEVTVEPGETTRDIVITTVQTRFDVLDFRPDGTFTLILGPPVRIEPSGACEPSDIFSTSGQCLGSYEKDFVIPG